jgi:predicted LPLAT superfamily acyltransferase
MHWATVSEAGIFLGIRLLHGIYRLGGRSCFRVCLWLVMPWFFLSRPLARRASRQYLTRLFTMSGGTTPRPTRINSFRHFMSFGDTILDKLVATDPRSRPEAPAACAGLEYFEALQTAGQGAVIMTAHFGNLELCRRLASEFHARIHLTLLVHTRHAERFNQMLKTLNPAQAIDLIQVDSVDVATAMLLSERVAAGGFVVIAGDRVPLALGSATLATSFLGAPARFPAGPYILAAALACPVLMLFGARGPAGFVVTVEKLSDRIVLPRVSRQNADDTWTPRERAIRPLLDAYVAALTRACLAHPLQWFNFFPFWISGETPE